MNFPIKDIIGALLVITSIGDALKYSIQALKIRQNQSSKNISRKFLNFAILNDIVKLGYGCVLIDWYIIISSLLAIVCMFHMYYEQYIFYPYRYRNLLHWKRPNIFVYIINSILPNRLRKHL